jgi:hypothetical protein
MELDLELRVRVHELEAWFASKKVRARAGWAGWAAGAAAGSAACGLL